jgi:RNA polymerase sigma-70 factor (ECF subfamily)
VSDAASSDAASRDDATAVARALAGDAAAYATLVRRHFAAAFAVAVRLTVTAEDAEDACQEAFARAYFRLAQCGDPTRFRGWLLQIVRHHAHNVRRYQALRAAASLDDVAEPGVRATGEHEVARLDLHRTIARAFDTLPPVKRRVMLHAAVDGWTHAQIAERLGISVTMSRRHLSDARATLRTTLGDLARDFFPGDDDE